jgi:uncharacterized protein YndB with AHSA1/START domain
MNARSSVATAASNREFVISRVLNAPRERVYKAWTDPKLMAQWWGPKEFTNPECTIDARPGGAFRIVMRGPDGTEFPYRGVFREVVPPERLVYTDDCSRMPDEWHDRIDPNRDKRAPKPSLESVTTVTFEALSDRRTKLTVRTLFATVAVRDAMIRMQITEGWTESLDKLEAVLSPR